MPSSEAVETTARPVHAFPQEALPLRAASASDGAGDCDTRVSSQEGAAVLRDFWVFDLPSEVALLAVNDAAVASASSPSSSPPLADAGRCCCRCKCFGRVLRFAKSRLCLKAAALASKPRPEGKASAGRGGEDDWREAAETCGCEACLFFLQQGGLQRVVASEHCVPSASHFLALKNALAKTHAAFAFELRQRPHCAQELRFSTSRAASASPSSERRADDGEWNSTAESLPDLREAQQGKPPTANAEPQGDTLGAPRSAAASCRGKGTGGVCQCFDAFAAAGLLGAIRLLCGFYLVLAERREVAGVLPSDGCEGRGELVFGVSSLRLVPLFAWVWPPSSSCKSVASRQVLHASAAQEAVEAAEFELQTKRFAAGGGVAGGRVGRACCSTAPPGLDAEELRVSSLPSSPSNAGREQQQPPPTCAAQSSEPALEKASSGGVSFRSSTTAAVLEEAEEGLTLRAARILLGRERRHAALLQLSVQQQSGGDASLGLFFSYGVDFTLSRQQHALSAQTSLSSSFGRRGSVCPCKVCGALHGKPLFAYNGHFVFNKHLLQQLLHSRGVRRLPAEEGLGEREEGSATTAGSSSSLCGCCVCSSSLGEGVCLRSWLVALTQGAFQQRLLLLEAAEETASPEKSQGGQLFLLSVVARRSRFALGTRFYRRGLERRPSCQTERCPEQGGGCCCCSFLGVANEVESEQTLWQVRDRGEGKEVESVFGDCASSLMHRGSIPIFWRHCSAKRNLLMQLLQPSPQTVIDLPADAVYVHAKRHLQWLLQRYGAPLLALDLVQQRHKTEGLLSAEYQKVVKLCAAAADEGASGVGSVVSKNQNNPTNSPAVSYAAFDFHAKTDALGFDAALAELAGVVSAGMRRHSFFAEGNAPLSSSSAAAAERSAPAAQKVRSLQRGIMRVNCIDCLDRTNIAHTAFGVVALYVHLRALGWTGAPPHFCRVSSSSLEPHPLLREALFQDARRRRRRSDALRVAAAASAAEIDKSGSLRLASRTALSQRMREGCDDGRDAAEDGETPEEEKRARRGLSEDFFASSTLVVEELAAVWRSVGDALSLQYAGSAALHAAEFVSFEANPKAQSAAVSTLSSLTSRRVADASSSSGAREDKAEALAAHAWEAAVDGLKGAARPWRARPRKSTMYAVQRFVSNKIYDADRQRAIELLQGRLRPRPGGDDVFAVCPSASPLAVEELEAKKNKAPPLPDVLHHRTSPLREREAEEHEALGESAASPSSREEGTAQQRQKNLARLKNFL